MVRAPSAWSLNSMSVRRISGSSAGDGVMGALRSTKRGIGAADFGADARSPASDRRLERRRVGPDVHGDVLGLEVLVEALGAALAAEARLLDAAERRPRVGDHALVEADHAGLQRLDDLERAVDVLGEDVGHQPVLG